MTRVWGLGWDGFPPYEKPEPWVRAIAIKQPHAWAVIHAGKDIENRSEAAANAYRPAVGRRVFIHASKGMTRAEYERAAAFMASIGVACPAPADLIYGGVIGSVLVERIVTRHSSPWFAGPVGLVLTDPRPEPFRPMRGQVGLFKVQP